MSTKTLLKRIALVAVSAMGFGLLSSVAPATASTTALTVTSIARAGVGASIKIASDSTTITTSEQAHWSLVSAPTGGALATGSGALVAASGTELKSYYTANIAQDTTTGNVLVAGTYTILVWVNTTVGTSGPGGAYPAIGDVVTSHTMTVAGAPSTVTITSPTTAVAAGTANGTFVATLKDANGANTVLTGNEALTLKAVQGTAVPAAGVVSIGTTVGTALAAADTTAESAAAQAITSVATAGVGVTGSNIGTSKYTFSVGNTVANTTTITVAGAHLQQDLHLLQEL